MFVLTSNGKLIQKQIIRGNYEKTKSLNIFFYSSIYFK